MALTTLLTNTILNTYFVNATTYLALHISDPTNQGLSDSELNTTTAPAYRRQRAFWSVPANRSTSNAQIVSWVGLPIVSCGYLGCWDQVTGGNLLAVFTTRDPLTVITTGGSIFVPVGGIAITIAGSPEGREIAVPVDPFAVYVEDPLNPGVIQTP